MSETPGGAEWWQASDGKWYPPQPPQYAPQAYPSQGPPAQGMSGCLKAFLIALGLAVVLGGVACVAFVVAVDDAADEVSESVDREMADEQARELEDIGEPECYVDDLGYAAAEVDVTNNSSERSNYMIELTFEAPDGSQLDTASTTASGLEPGQTTTASASTVTEAVEGEFSCRVLEVDRFSDE
jgi:hypothetical protein